MSEENLTPETEPVLSKSEKMKRAWETRRANAAAKTPASPSSAPTKEAASPSTQSESWDVIEVGIEKTALGNDLGDFEPPPSFNKAEYCVAWGVKTDGDFGAFPSVAELQAPKRYPELGLVHPGWRQWMEDGKNVAIKGGKLILMYCPRKIQDAINKASSEFAKRRLKEREKTVRTTLAPIPSDVKAADDAEERRFMEQVNQLTAAGI